MEAFFADIAMGSHGPIGVYVDVYDYSSNYIGRVICEPAMIYQPFKSTVVYPCGKWTWNKQR